jgi:Nif-specific regulatory protein
MSDAREETTNSQDRDDQEHSRRHDRELQALHAIAQVLSRYSGQEKALHAVLGVLDQRLGYGHGTIMLLSPDGRELLVEAVQNGHAQGKRDATYSRGEGITGRVLQSGTTAVIPHIHSEPEFRGRVHDRRHAETSDLSFICVPVTIGEDVVGTLSADLPYPGKARLVEAERVMGIVSGMIANDVKARRLARLERRALEEENLRLRSELGEKHRPENVVGTSHLMQELYQRIEQVAASDTTVLIRGESGTGKELIAAAIHYASARSDRPFVKVNCAALSEGLLESELFGHEKGAFTGATQTRIGRIEEADHGTLMLDEIGDFSLTTQVKLLRVLQERQFERVGSNATINADVRIICATHQDLEKAVEEGRFRQDLYYRINVVPLHVPPLRERKDDIMQLANHFAAHYAETMGKQVHRISTTAINMMMAYHWPGNVRELENCIEHAVLLSSDGVIHGYNLPASLQVPADSDLLKQGKLKARVQLLEKDLIIDALKSTGGSVRLAAEQLGITPRMVRYKIKGLDIDYDGLFKKRKG